MALLISNYQSRWLLKQKHTGNLYGFFEHFSEDIHRQEDDFHGPIIDPNKWTGANGGGASAASPAIDVGLVGGAIKMVTGTAGDSTASSTLAGGRHFRGDMNAIMQARVKIETVLTSVKVEIGFRDAITNGAIVNVKATPSFTATDGACWILDTNENVNWDGLAVANAVAATSLKPANAAVNLVASTYGTFQVALVDGVAFFSAFDVDGKRIYGPIAVAAAVTKTVVLSAHVYIEARNATSKTLNVDKVKAYAARTTA